MFAVGERRLREGSRRKKFMAALLKVTVLISLFAIVAP